MTSGNDDRFLVREFKFVLEKAKSDALLFAILTVLLTPFLLLALVAVFIFALAFVDLPVIDHLGFARSFLTGANLLRPSLYHREQTHLSRVRSVCRLKLSPNQPGTICL